LRGEPTTYWDYLHLPDLLNLQHGIDSKDSELAQDEIHFIMVHQVFELWFKLTLHELRLASRELASPRVPEEKIPFVVHHLGRVNTILQLAISQFDVMETLDPQDFISFRDKLVPASGMQSYQYRILEILLGIESDPDSDYGTKVLAGLERMTQATKSGPDIWKQVEDARKEISLRGALHSWLLRTPIDPAGSPDPGGATDSFIEAYLAGFETSQRETLETVFGTGDPKKLEERLAESVAHVRGFLLATDVAEAHRDESKQVRAGILFIESYRDLPLLAWPRLLLDTIVVLEERMLLWRTRHIRMVERIIGRRIGTGGTSGVGYLTSRSELRIFPELWTARTILLGRSYLPPLQNPGFYDFEERT